MKRFDVVLIGSGISSLTAAAILAKKGKSVCVLEQYTKPGGYLHCFNRFGQRFETGAHYVGAMAPGEAFHTLLHYTGAYADDLFIPLDPDGFDVFHFPERTVSFPKGYSALVQRLSEMLPSEKAAIEKYFALVQGAVKHFQTYEFNEHVDMNALMKNMETSLAQVVEGLTSNRTLQGILYTYCVLHGTAPADTPFGMHAVLSDSFIRSPHGLKNGGDYLANRYVQSIRQLGGEVHMKQRVKEVEIKNGLATAVLTDKGERIEADCVISGIHPKNTLQLISDRSLFSPIFRDRIENLQESIGFFGIYAVLKNSADLNPLRNYYYFTSDDPKVMLSAGSRGDKPCSIFLAPSSRLSRPGENMAINLHAAGPIEWFREFESSRFGKRPADYEEIKKVYTERVFDLVSDYHPHIRETLDRVATSTPLTNLHFNGSPEGSSYGVYHSIQNTGARGLGPRTRIANLHLTGQSTLFPGLLGAAIAGLRTAGHVVGIKALITELKQLGESLK